MVMLVCVCLGNYLGGVEFFFFCWNPALEFLSLKGAIVQASQSFWESPDYWSFLLTFRIQKSVNFQNVDGHFSHFWLLFLHACCMAVHAHHSWNEAMQNFQNPIGMHSSYLLFTTTCCCYESFITNI